MVVAAKDATLQDLDAELARRNHPSGKLQYLPKPQGRCQPVPGGNTTKISQISDFSGEGECIMQVLDMT